MADEDLAWFELGEQQQFSEPGSVHEVVAGDRILALANVDGRLMAVDGICPHQGGPLGKGHLAGCVLTCPWHGWTFDLDAGETDWQKGGADQHHSYPVRVQDGQVAVQLPVGG